MTFRRWQTSMIGKVGLLFRARLTACFAGSVLSKSQIEQVRHTRTTSMQPAWLPSTKCNSVSRSSIEESRGARVDERTPEQHTDRKSRDDFLNAALQSADKDVRLIGKSAAGMFIVLQRHLRHGQPMTVFSADKKSSTPVRRGGPAISRGSSEGHPRIRDPSLKSTPEGSQQLCLHERRLILISPVMRKSPVSLKRAVFHALLVRRGGPGCDPVLDSGPGVSLAHPRLMAATPAGVEMQMTSPKCALKIEPLWAAR